MRSIQMSTLCVQKYEFTKIIIEIPIVFMYNDRVVVLALILSKTLQKLIKNRSCQQRPTTKMGLLPIEEENA